MADRDDILKERQEQEYLGVWRISNDGCLKRVNDLQCEH